MFKTISYVPFFVCLLLAAGILLFFYFIKSKRLLTEEQRINFNVYQGSIFRTVLVLLPFLLLYLNFIPDSLIAQIVLLGLALFSFLSYGYFFAKDIKYFRKMQFSTKAVAVYFASGILLLAAYLFFNYYIYLYLGQNAAEPIKNLDPFLLIYLPISLLWGIYRQKKQQSLGPEARKKLLAANRGELLRMNTVFLLTAFAYLFIGLLILTSLFNAKGESLSHIISIGLFFLGLVAIFVFRYRKEQEILRYYGLPVTYLRFTKTYAILVLVGSLAIATISFLIRQYL